MYKSVVEYTLCLTFDVTQHLWTVVILSWGRRKRRERKDEEGRRRKEKGGGGDGGGRRKGERRRKEEMEEEGEKEWEEEKRPTPSCTASLLLTSDHGSVWEGCKARSVHFIPPLPLHHFFLFFLLLFRITPFTCRNKLT